VAAGMQVILPQPGIADIEVRFHVGPLVQIQVKIGVGIAVTILAVNITYAPGGVFYFAGRGMSHLLVIG
jgi:hypothetical protein